MHKSVSSGRVGEVQMHAEEPRDADLPAHIPHVMRPAKDDNAVTSPLCKASQYARLQFLGLTLHFNENGFKKCIYRITEWGKLSTFNVLQHSTIADLHTPSPRVCSRNQKQRCLC